MFTWVKVHRDLHVEVARALYSVPERRFAREPGSSPWAASPSSPSFAAAPSPPATTNSRRPREHQYEHERKHKLLDETGFVA